MDLDFLDFGFMDWSSMDWIFLLTFFIYDAIGLVLYCYLFLQCVLSIKVSKKCMKITEQLKLNANYTAIRSQITSHIIIFGFLYIAISTIALLIPYNNVYGFAFGTIMGIVFSIKQCGLNTNNVSDYLRTFGMYYNEPLELIASTIMNNTNWKKQNKKSISKILAVIFAIISLLLTIALAMAVNNYNYQNEEINDLRSKVSKAETKYNAVLQYLSDVKSVYAYPTFGTQATCVIPIALGTIVTYNFVLDEYGEAYMYTDNDNIEVDFTDYNNPPIYPFKIKGIKRGLSTITFESDSKKVNVFVIVY